jgi:fructose-bisphosphate aldolase class II
MGNAGGTANTASTEVAAGAPEASSGGLEGVVPAGVVTGDQLLKLLEYCRAHGHALPAFYCTSTSIVNAVLRAARDVRSPVVLVLPNDTEEALMAGGSVGDAWKDAVARSRSMAENIRLMAKHYGVPVVLHSEHLGDDPLAWMEDMTEADEDYFDVSTCTVAFARCVS